MIVFDIIINFVLQIALTVGSIFLFGWLIAICNNKFYNNFGKNYLTVCYVTGFIGTPIHECSHALMCLIFGHKIEEIKLFQLSSNDGTLGYVQHSYNPTNKYHRVGNFFIGVAPIICISTILYGLANLLVPDVIYVIVNSSKTVSEGLNFSMLFDNVEKVAITLFASMASWQFWVYILISMFLALHMTLSKVDMEGAKDGLILVIIVLFVVNLIFGLIGNSLYERYCDFMMQMSGVLNTMLILSLCISLLSLLISKVIGRFF